MMANGDDTLIHLIHTIWSAVLTAVIGGFAWLVQWNWNKVTTQLDQLEDKKADKTEVTSVRSDFSNWQDRQDRQHVENRKRLDDIYQLLANGKRRDGS